MQQRIWVAELIIQKKEYVKPKTGNLKKTDEKKQVEWKGVMKSYRTDGTASKKQTVELLKNNNKKKGTKAQKTY